MGIKIQIPCKSQYSDMIWEIEMDPGEVRRLLGAGAASYGRLSILVVGETPTYVEKAKDTLLVDPATLRVLNIGSSSRTILIADAGAGEGAPGLSASGGVAALPVRKGVPGDKEFLEKLPLALRELGIALLGEVRRHHRGELEHTRSGKFVDRPDGFWTVKIQPLDVSLRITVRGRPETFAGNTKLAVQSDIKGYSRFKISKMDELDAAVKIIMESARR